MKRLECALEDSSKLAFSKATGLEREQNEDWKAFEERTWRKKTHIDEKENVIIPPSMFKGAITGGVKYLNIKIPGERNATFTKNFTAGVIVENGIDLKVKRDKLQGEWVYVPSDGKPGGSSRVYKKFPYVESWSGNLIVMILDPKISLDIFKEVLEAAGTFIGIGFWRPQKGGSNGRFKVLSIKEIK